MFLPHGPHSIAKSNKVPSALPLPSLTRLVPLGGTDEVEVQPDGDLDAAGAGSKPSIFSIDFE